MFKVKEIARLIGVDRSFLHYYDEIGIIVPSKNDKNYRLYNENDLIALASSKYYRAMEMPLHSLSEIIQESDVDLKIEVMEKRKEAMKKEIEKMNDMLVVTDYAISTYKMAYQDELSYGECTEAEFIPTIIGGKYDESLLESSEMKELLNFFPFVSYSYYFPIDSLIENNKFEYYIGLSTISHFRKKYDLKLPEHTIKTTSEHCIFMSLTKNMNEGSFTYEDFELARNYAKENNLHMTGEAIGYCVFSNYSKNSGDIKFVVQIFTK